MPLCKNIDPLAQGDKEENQRAAKTEQQHDLAFGDRA